MDKHNEKSLEEAAAESVAQDLAQDLAQDCADAMWRGDSCSKALGISILDIAPGYARLSLKVRADMLNGQGNCHGGIMFTLADSAFAFSCNTYNQFTVAQHCDISFLQPVAEGATLIATAQERWREGRGGIYDVSVSTSDGQIVAEFRGRSRTVPGQHVEQC